MQYIGLSRQCDVLFDRVLAKSLLLIPQPSRPGHGDCCGERRNGCKGLLSALGQPETN